MIFGSAAAEQAIASSHTALVKAEAWAAGRKVDDLPIVKGSRISVDASRFVRRQGSLVFQEQYSGARSALAALLSRPGMEVRCWRGVQLGEGSYFWPVHWGMVSEPSVEERTRTISISSPDRAQRIVDNRFLSPRSSRAGFTVAQQIQQLIGESIYRVGFEDQSGDATAVPPMVWERDRAAAITDMARSIGCEFFMSPAGQGVLRPIPKLTSVPSWSVRSGVNLTSQSATTDWSEVYNIIVAESARSDLPPMRGVAQDNDPASPTYVGITGRGPNPGWWSSSMLTSAAQCLVAAEGILARTKGARTSVQFEGLVHPGIEASDRIDVQRDRLVLDNFEIDLFGATLGGNGRTKVDVVEGVS